VRPDAGIILDVSAGPIECFLEWDRATETQERLQEKIEHYQIAEAKLHDATQVCSVLFVVPGQGRLTTLRRAYMALEPKRERHRQDRAWSTSTVAGRCSPRPRRRCTTQGR
jgi:hypothetical protein